MKHSEQALVQNRLFRDAAVELHPDLQYNVLFTMQDIELQKTGFDRHA